jgi:phosphoglycolate phosphatase
VRHLFFDLDGTLTDPAPGIGACFLHTARTLGLAHVCEAGAFAGSGLRRWIGPPLREAFVEILATRDPARVEEAVRIYRERFSTVGLFENSVYPGVPEMLQALREAGFVLSLVTSKAAVYAERIVEHFGLREHLPRVYGAELGGERSTKAELIAHALEREGLRAIDACMIGDREHDVLGAKANALRAIGVTWGYGTRAELEAAGADRVVDTREGLVAALSSPSGLTRSGARS